MPKNQSTAAQRARAAARAGGKYTTVLRENRTSNITSGETSSRARPAHMARWSQPTHMARLAAGIRSRGTYLHQRFPSRAVRGRIVFNDSTGHLGSFLEMLYDLTVTARPELAPVVAAAVVKVADFEAIDALFAPLDRAVRCFLAQVPHTVWQQQLAAHIEALREQSGPGWETRNHMIGWYDRAMAERIGFDGYPTRDGFPYSGACGILDAILVTTAGGYAPGSLVRLRDDRTVYVLDVQWWDEHGGPDGYTVVPVDKGGDFEVRADQVAGPADSSSA